MGRAAVAAWGLALLMAIVVAVPSLAAETNHWRKIATDIDQALARAEAMTQAGKPEDAKQAVTAAYFDLFENSKMEAAIRKEIGAKAAILREKGFADLRKAITRAAPEPERAAIILALRSGLMDDAARLDAQGVPPDVFAVNQ
ncbi:High-affinity iron transporter component 1 [Magnetospirillum sp. LM-5]|uniref:hypothetical protein n=1 Tax=Magnetospirillum sp. LM-5 TaxID=2681466 RepID=UPI001383B612|nr:hypothetical protein [Magnetospirillum sp. LM-5]CAA7614986.1 High-affinity iron transporter component 1 [Magnetospirillum sp. LM-5]